MLNADKFEYRCIDVDDRALGIVSCIYIYSLHTCACTVRRDNEDDLTHEITLDNVLCAHGSFTCSNSCQIVTQCSGRFTENGFARERQENCGLQSRERVRSGKLIHFRKIVRLNV